MFGLFNRTIARSGLKLVIRPREKKQPACEPTKKWCGLCANMEGRYKTTRLFDEYKCVCTLDEHRVEPWTKGCDKFEGV